MSKLISNKKKKNFGVLKPYYTTTIEVYKRFCEEHSEVDITFERWKNVIMTHNESFVEYLLDTGDRTKLRWLGSFSVIKKKARRFINAPDGKQFIALPIDWPKTMKAGKRVYNFNAHSDGYRYSWRWTGTDARWEMWDIWWFKPCRKMSRRITEYVKMGADQQEKYKDSRFIVTNGRVRGIT